MKNYTPTFEEFVNEAKGPDLLNPATPSKNFFKDTNSCDTIKKVIDKPFIAAYKEFVDSGKVTAKTNYKAVQARNALIAFYDISLAMICNRSDDYIEYKRNIGEHRTTKVADDRIWAMESFAYELASKGWSDDIRRNLEAITASNLKKLMNYVIDILLKEIKDLKDAADRREKGVFDLSEALKLSTHTGKYADYLVDKKAEKKYGNKYSWNPAPPITILSAEINMNDEYNGDINISLSNGDTIRYTCIEDRNSTMGPNATISVYVNGDKIGGDEWWDDYAGAHSSWIGTLMLSYEDWYKKTNKIK